MEGRRWRLTGGCGLWKGGGGSQQVGVAYGGEEVEANRWVWLMEGREEVEANRWVCGGGGRGVHPMGLTG